MKNYENLVSPDSIDKIADHIYRWKKRFVKAFPPTQFSYCWSNFDTMHVWPRMIEYLGPPKGYSSETYESIHKDLRATGENANYIAKDLKMMLEVRPILPIFIL